MSAVVALVAVLAFALVAACAEPPPPSGLALDLTRPTTGPAPRIAMQTLPLATQADFDALEDETGLGSRQALSLLALYEHLAASARPAARPEDALLLMRLAVLYRTLEPSLRERDGDNAPLQKALAIGTRLRAEAPTSPHTLFLQGYIPFTFLGGSQASALVVTRDMREFAAACRDQWRLLLAADPAYDGPQKLDAALLADTSARIDRALAELEAAPPEPAEPTPAVAASRAEVEALGTAARFDAATEGDRKTICRDWDAARAKADPTVERSRDELRLDLACATFSGKAEVALPIIVHLRESGPAFDACYALERLRDRADAGRIDLALRQHPIDCPAPR